MKKLLVCMLVLALLLPMSALAAEGTEELIFWHSMSGNNGVVLTEIVEAFNASQSQYKVVMEYQGSYEDTIAKLKSTPAGARPDIVQLAEVNTCWMAYSDYYIPIQDMIDAAQLDVSDYQAAILGYYTLNGKLLSMPFNCSVPAIIYNADVLAKAEIDPAELDTLDGVLAASRKIQELELARYGCVFNGEGFVIENYFGMLGAEITDAHNGHEGVATKLVIDENGSAEKLFSKWLELVSDDSVVSFGGDSAAASEGKKEFTAGNIALYIGSCGAFGNLKSSAADRFAVEIRSLPKVSAEDPFNLTVGGGSFWIVNNGENSKSDGAFEFLLFTASTEMQAKWAAATGYLPVSKSAQGTEDYQAFVEQTKDFGTVLAAMDESTAEGAGPLFGVSNLWRTVLGNELHNLMEEEDIAVADAIEAICSQVNDEIELYNEANGLV